MKDHIFAMRFMRNQFKNMAPLDQIHSALLPLRVLGSGLS